MPAVSVFISGAGAVGTIEALIVPYAVTMVGAQEYSVLYAIIQSYVLQTESIQGAGNAVPGLVNYGDMVAGTYPVE
jgi:hypothetical protein